MSGGDDRAALRCAHCGYALRGSASLHCPECGFCVAETRHAFETFRRTRLLSDGRYPATLRRSSWVLCLLPAMVAGLVAALYLATGLGKLAFTAAVLSVLSVVFAPILALVTMPWRGVYADARRYTLRGRLAVLVGVWLLLASGLLWAYARGW